MGCNLTYYSKRVRIRGPADPPVGQNFRCRVKRGSSVEVTDG